MRIKVSKEVIKKRVGKLRLAQELALQNIDNLHVKLQPGNKKTGANCWTVSLLPIIDCVNCNKCQWECYDIIHDMIYKQCINDRARNSAIHKADRKRFWNEVDMQIKANYVTELRINVGGDLQYEDFKYITEIGRNNRRTKILFFTKNYKGINKYLEDNFFPENVHPIMSAWSGVKMDNPHNLPCSHVLFEDGKTTAPEYGAYYCKGNCSECGFKEEGCWKLKEGQHVIFKVH